MNPRTAHVALAAATAALVSASAFAHTATASPTPPLPTAEPLPTSTPAGGSSPAGETPAAQPRQTVLSNERTSTTWAHPVEVASIHARPEPASRTIARTRLVTEDGYPEVYMLLATYLDGHGRVWVRIRVPGRPNGLIGWLPADDLGSFHVTHWHIVISLGRRRLTAYLNGHLRFTVPVGVGKPSTPTPTGHFWIRERFKLTNPGNPYWPWAFGTSAYSRLTDWPGGGVVGIHGDFGEPQAIPGDPSHGCVRIRNSDLLRVGPQIQVGTPVTIVR